MPKMKILLLGAAAVFSTGGMIWTQVLQAQSNQERISVPGLGRAPGLQRAKVRFKDSIKLESALAEVRGKGGKAEQIIRQYQAGGQTVTEGFYIGDNEKADATAITNEYWKSYDATLQDMLSNEPEAMPEEDVNREKLKSTHLENLEQERQQFFSKKGCWENNACPEISIIEMVVSGDNTVISKLKQSQGVREVQNYDELKQQRIEKLKQRTQGFRGTENTSSFSSQPANALIASLPINLSLRETNSQKISQFSRRTNNFAPNIAISNQL